MEPFIFRVRDCYYIRASYPSPAEHRHFAAHLVFALERPFTALVDGKSVETVGIAIGSDVPHTILSVDPALVVFIDELTPMSRCVKHTLLEGAPWRTLDASVSSRVRERWGKVRTETDAAAAASVSVRTFPHRSLTLEETDASSVRQGAPSNSVCFTQRLIGVSSSMNTTKAGSTLSIVWGTSDPMAMPTVSTDLPSTRAVKGRSRANTRWAAKWRCSAGEG